MATYNDMKIFRSFLEATEELPAEQFKEAWLAVLHYGMDGKEDDMSPTAKLFLSMAKPVIDNSIALREGGAKGGKASPKPTPSPTEAYPKPTPSLPEAYPKPCQQEEGIRNKEEGIRSKDIKEKGKEKNKKESADERRDVFETCTPELKTEVLKFVEHRKKLRKPMTEHAIELLINKLNVIGVNDNQRIELLQTAIEHGWLTVYKPDDKKEARKAPAGKTNKFNQFEQRSYDYDSLEAELLGIGGTA